MEPCRFCRRMGKTCKNFYSKFQKLRFNSIRRSLPDTAAQEPIEQHQHVLERVQTLEPPLMRLAAELRMQIYGHLIPNVAVVTTTKDRLRRDNGSCYPAMLRTNQKIYHEMVELWYKSTRYSIYFESGSLGFIPQTLPTTLTLPFGFQFLKQLDLTVRFVPLGSVESLKRIPRDQPNARWGNSQQHLARLEALSQYFSPSGPGNLQDLKLNIICGPHYFRNHALGDKGHDLLSAAEQEPLIRASLELNLQHLRNIRVSGSVRVMRLKAGYSTMGCSGDVKKHVSEVTRLYLKRLEGEILGAYDWPEDLAAECSEDNELGKNTTKYTEQVEENLLATGRHLVRM